jgi:N-glycosylase/DNA lyase
MVKTTLKITKPDGFNFRRTVLSHGWYDLKPFELDKENWILTRVFELEEATPITAEICETENEIEVTIYENVSQSNAARIIRETRHILRLDDDFADFYAIVQGEEQLAWVAESGAGRLLRSPTVWEDLIKSICTTNCSWALTRKMVENLVDRLGDPTSDGTRKTFPAPEKMAAEGVEFYRNEIRAGYRSEYFAELANRVASGDIDVESWVTSDLSTAELKKQIKHVKGVGDYAAENLLKLLGRYDGLALDSWLRMSFAKTHYNGESCSDKIIYAHYERFGEWRGLAIWCDMTKNWL